MKAKNEYEQWFAASAGTLAGSSKMESALYDWAKEHLLRHLVCFTDFKNVLKELDAVQERLSANNPRWKRVKVRFSGGADGICWLHIGDVSHLCLYRVEGEF